MTGISGGSDLGFYAGFFFRGCIISLICDYFLGYLANAHCIFTRVISPRHVPCRPSLLIWQNIPDTIKENNLQKTVTLVVKMNKNV